MLWHLANELSLSGWARNTASGVELHLEGETGRLNDFFARLSESAPPNARIDAIQRRSAALTGAEGFSILANEGEKKPAAQPEFHAVIGPDLGICADCLTELFTPASRRYRYPLLACAHCGPRYSVTCRLPYDRAATTLADYPFCADCAAEYTDPSDRRFHAETSACPVCGPAHFLLDRHGKRLEDDPARGVWRRIQAGGIVAIKGMSGFHLVCDAQNAEAISRLRRQKQRESKPFALMAANLASLSAWVTLDEESARLLTTPARPIVLLPLRAGLSAVDKTMFSRIAPGLARLGVMLPATPAQWLLCHEAAGAPEGLEWTKTAQPTLFLMTSANPGGEPIVSDNAAAICRLSEVADLFWMHEREIVLPSDDSLLLPAAPKNPPIFIRRARGFAPERIALAPPPRSAGMSRDVLALGAYLKNSCCVTRGNEAFLSQYIGSLNNAASVSFLERAARRLCALFSARPDVIAHDLHPDFPSTWLAQRLAAEWRIPTLAVAHHHAHIAAACAEYRLEPPVLGLALDGTGLGEDRALWGGELLCLSDTGYRRIGHLRPLPLPGGDAAAREPWRVAVALFARHGRSEAAIPWLARRFPARRAEPLLTLLDKGFNCPESSSLGRIFDAASALLGLCDRNHYDAEAAMKLENQALRALDRIRSDATLAQLFHLEGEILDLSPLLFSLADENDANEGAARFHLELVCALAAWTLRAVEREKISTVVLSGGCLQNALLARLLAARLSEAGVKPYIPAAAPPGDGGLALGQAWIARRAASFPPHP
jgi:hydrogenase maturation protein HypF